MGEDAGTIVVGYDGREPSGRALEAALRDAGQSGSRVVAVVVGALPVADDPYAIGAVGWANLPPVSPDGPEELQPLLAAARERMAAAGVDGEAVWGLGDPASEIVRVAREVGATRIVVGRHHHSALGRFFGTDVAASIAEEAGCEVVVAE